MPKYRLDLFAGAACDFWLKRADGLLIPLPSPTTRHERRLVEGGEKKLNFRPRSNIGPGGSRLTVRVRSREPPVRASVVLGQSQNTWAWDQNL